MISSLTLGTVQFGLQYGIANQVGQISLGEASNILQEAWENGVRTLDTAVAYGESEQVLGQIGVNDWSVVSKLPPLPTDVSLVHEWVDSTIASSLSRLKVNNLAGLLLHNSANLLEEKGEELYAALARLKRQGIVKKIGISIYDVKDIDSYLAKYELDIVQLPLNVFDRRLIRSGRIDQFTAMGIEIHVRSVFLQGLLLMESKFRPPYFNQWATLLSKWDDWILQNQITRLEASLGFVGSVSGIDKIIVGVDSRAHLSEIIENSVRNRLLEIPDEISSEDPNLILPYNWKS
ncbi:aldo/keto reductase [Leptospira adleri]|uniref:Aldo/keto reductase n=1 Tax=Leptospira adleri TaxID=2023186 RepID=A0A2M9YPD2_9LEPT|nr:aldo/keto reductase [Leptospira adleri]PJZ53378.1 aldo/keto reductase [Leptospira adleri]PJZ61821.1 aldo/keto reductase [Leptospira adleri]